MGVEGCGKVIKYWLFTVNLFVFVAGLVLLGFGIYIKTEFGDYIRFDTQTSFDYVHGANVLIGAGVLMSVVSFLGCCGAFKENKVLLIIYAVVISLIFVLEIVGGALAYSYRGELEENVHAVFNSTLQQEYGQPENDGLDGIVDRFMEKGCWPKFKDMATSKYGLIGGLGIGVGVILMLTVILASILVCQIKSSGTFA